MLHPTTVLKLDQNDPGPKQLINMTESTHPKIRPKWLGGNDPGPKRPGFITNNNNKVARPNDNHSFTGACYIFSLLK